MPNCLECDANLRKHNTDANGFCKVTFGTDGLPVKCVGAWGREKIFTVSQYLGIFADSVKDKFDHLNYLEICSGPGRCVTRNKIEVDGTPLVVLRHRVAKYLSSIVFVDIDKNSVDTLNKRITRLNPQLPARAYIGDYNDTKSLDEALNHLNLDGRSLTLCVLDPYDCSMPFEVIRYVKNRIKKCDFIISYFDGLDAKRNFRTALKRKDSKEVCRFARFLGLDDAEMHSFINSQEVLSALDRGTTRDLMACFASKYEESLNKLGLKYCDYRSIRKNIDTGVEFYRLLFACEHKLGLTFWRKIGCYSSTGQRQFVFEEDF